ncbi:hypothetical protein HGRIS_010356 [Hohenbuehelia grisea]|uniref:Yeast cell wall synthesis Kre9/Knh1-like N-terminal domain-containing protein n=1 Tax=Hohenbuehelia grisea TaxID=104357 RepID=A0ABR3J4H1_9AGAR
MLFSSCIFASASALFMLGTGVHCSPLMPRGVYVPPLTSPTLGTVWTVGETHTVTWDTSKPPSQITNRSGKIMLRKGEKTLDLTLASGFNITAGSAEVTVPDVTAGDDYMLVLFGNSGNFSPKFSIKEL